MSAATTTERTLTAHEAATFLEQAADLWAMPRIGPGTIVVWAPKHLAAGDEILAPHVGEKWVVRSIHDHDQRREVHAALLSNPMTSTMLGELELKVEATPAQAGIAVIYRTLAEKIREMGLGIAPDGALGRIVAQARRDMVQ